MAIFKVVFWLFFLWLLATLATRIYWFKKVRYGYTSWFFEFVLACLSCVGVHVVAYEQPLFNQAFWWLVFSSVVVSSVYRVRSDRFKEQVNQLTERQTVFIKGLMALFTLPIAGILFINAANVTGVWNS